MLNFYSLYLMIPENIRTVSVTHKQRCTICRSISLAPVLDLPQLPLTGIYVEGHERDDRFPKVDQTWMLCLECGHGQLKYIIDPEYLYEDTYTHRGGVSPIASGGNDFFTEFVNRVAGQQHFRLLVDVGCSDLYLLRKLRSRADQAVGVDPIWIGKNHVSPEGIRVIGKYVEQVNWGTELPEKPDFIVSAHTFEHVNEAGAELARIVDAAADNALIIIEVPGTDSMISALRFDQVFHQHINYYSVASFKRLIQELGCTYLTHTFNFSFWSGTMLMAFTKQRPSVAIVAEKKNTPETALRAFSLFKNQLATLTDTLAHIEEPIWGYGGAQMLPILAYHMDSDLGFLEGILDDNPGRHGKNFPHLLPIIRLPDTDINYRDSAILVTALDSVRPILRRVHALNPRRVLLPLQLH